MRREGLYAVSMPKYRPKCERPEVTETRNLLLQQDFELSAINQVWHVDITYVPAGEAWLYLAGVLDGFSKCVVGYAMSDNMKTNLVMQALRAAVKRRNPAPGLAQVSDSFSYVPSAFQIGLEPTPHPLTARECLSAQSQHQECS